MTLRAAFPAALRALRERPALLVVGVVVAALQFATVLAGAALALFYLTGLWATLAPWFGLLLSVLTWPLLAGIYVPVAEPPTATRSTLATAVVAGRRHYRDLLAADLSAAAVAVVGGGLGGAFVWLVTSTAVQFGRYALVDPAPPLPVGALFVVAGAGVVGVAVAGLTVRFADAFVLFAGVAPRRAWLSSLRFARARPVSLLGYGVAVAVVNGGPTLLVAWFSGRVGGDPLGVAAIVAVGVVLSGAAVAVTASLHVTYFRTTVAPAVDRRQMAVRRDVSWRRVGLAAAVVLSVVAGAAAIRVADVRPADKSLEQLPADPTAAYETAVTNTKTSNHRSVLLARNASDPTDSFSPITTSGVDYRDRQLYFYFYNGNGSRHAGGFSGEGTFASLDRDRPYRGWAVRTPGNWTVDAMPGYGLMVDVAGEVPQPGGNWTVVAENASTVVLRVERPADVREALPVDSVRGLQGEMAPDSHLTVSVDRERRVVTRATFHLHSLETGENWRYVLRYEDVGTADLRRPDGVGPRHPAAWGWDLLYY